MANPSHDKGNAPMEVQRTYMTDEQAERWAWEQVKRDVGTAGWTVGDSCNYFGFFLWGWRYRAQYLRQRATPPSPSTAPEVGGTLVDVAMRTHMDAARKGANLYGCIQASLAAALASRPAEVDDEGLPPLPKKRGTIYQGNYWTDWDEADPPSVPLADVFTAEQYRQGQRDAVAADRARRGDDWISVKDQLPEIGREVLVYRPKSERGTVTALARFTRYEEASDFYWDNSYPGKGNMHLDTSITHWMPIPAAPSHATKEAG